MCAVIDRAHSKVLSRIVLDARTVSSHKLHPNLREQCGRGSAQKQPRTMLVLNRLFGGDALMKHGSWVCSALVLLLVFGVGSSTLVFAQGGANASISGIVQDQSQALIPGVTVTATNLDTGIKFTAITNEAGAYGFPSVAPGRYSISASLPGFRTTTINDLNTGNVQVRQDITLEVASAATSVEVTATADAVLRESSASIGDVLT